MTNVSDVNGGNGFAKAAKGKAAKGRAKAPMKPVKAAKARKARTINPAKLDQFGFRKGSIKSRAAAMYASKQGATLRGVRDKVGSNQFNLITELEGKGFKFTRELVPGAGHRQATRYHLIAS